MNFELIRNAAIVAGLISIFSILVGGGFLLLFARKIKRIEIPAGATFVETLHYTPLSVVLAIDLLDLTLDILAAPLSWAILDRLGLTALRGVAAVEALIPGTQIIPTFTLCWFGVRLFGIR